MGGHSLVSERSLRNSLQDSCQLPSTLWTQLTPQQQRQVAQHWAQLMKQMKLSKRPSQEEHDAGES
jgi:hypothetical protein